MFCFLDEKKTVSFFPAGGERKERPEKNLPQLVAEEAAGWTALVLG